MTPYKEQEFNENSKLRPAKGSFFLIKGELIVSDLSLANKKVQLSQEN